MKLLRDAWLIAAKDLRAWRRDRTGLLFGLLLPIALVTAMGFLAKVLYGGGGPMGRTDLWVADEDRSEASADLLAALRAAATVRVRPGPEAEPLSVEEVRRKVEDASAHHALIVPAGFGEELAAGGLPELRMIRDPGRRLEDTLVSLALVQAYMAISEGRSWPAMMGRQMEALGLEPEQAQAVVAASESVRALIERFLPGGDEEPEAGGAEGGAAAGTGFDMSAFLTGMVPVAAEDIQPPGRPKELGYMQAQSVSGMVVMMLMFGLVACGSTLIVEREKGTLTRLLAAPVSRDSILLGKLFFSAAVGLIQLSLLFAYGELLFDLATFRDPVTLLVLMLSLTAAVTGFGLLVAVLARTQKQAEGVSTILILVMSCLGGAWFPIQLFAVPTAVEVIMRLTLTHWAMTGFQNMFFHQKSWHDPATLPAVVVLWGFALAAFLAARAIYHRRLASAS
ncbi:MAG: ABC transporter permease [Planctomycetota bacterium]|nr:MAG: ABC transporter permease [Planctomycetota bacterium]